MSIISSYRGPSTDRLPFNGVLTDEHYIAVTAYRSPGRPFHANPHIVAIGFFCIEDAIRRAQTLDGNEYLDIEVHILAKGWGYPDLCSRVWDHRGIRDVFWLAEQRAAAI